MDGDANDGYLTTAEFERLRRRAQTYREDLVVALAGRVGLRPSELTRIRPADLREREYGGEVHFLLTVPEGDGDTREAYVPPPVAHDLRKFANANDVDRHEPVVDVSARRVQMLVSDVADRTDDLQDVTCRDLRHHFAWRLLVEEGVAPRIVQTVGGWSSLQSLAPYLDEPSTAEVLDALADRSGRRRPRTASPKTDRLRDVTQHTDRPQAGPPYTDRPQAGPPYTDRPQADPPHTDRRRTDPPRAGHPRPGSSAHSAGRRRPADARSDDLLACAGELGAALADASTSEDAERAACDRLADAYRAVWICDDGGEVRASAAPERADDVPGEVVSAADAPDGAGDAPDSEVSGGDTPADSARDAPADSEASGGDASAVTVVEGPTDGVLSGCSVAVSPLRSNETVHGLLCVAHDAFGSADRTFLADVGRRVGRRLTAIARKQLLLADTGVELSLRTTDEDVFLVSASADLDCRFELEGVVPVEDHSLLYFVTATGAAVGDVLERVSRADSVDESRLVRDYGDGALFEFAVSGESVATLLVERGGTVRDLSAEAGVADVSGVFSRRVDVRRVVEAVEETFPETHLRSKREVEQPVRSAASVRRTVTDRITERQQTVLRAAYLAGYFEWPRGSTAEELAASMGISSPTLHNHLRKAQQKVLDAVFDGPDPG